MRRRRYGYNQLKLRVLMAFRDAPSGWLTPGQVMLQIGFCCRCSASSYVSRLQSFGLLRRRRYPFLEFSLTPKGMRRLMWLERN
jgi:hypothetical protein